MPPEKKKSRKTKKADGAELSLEEQYFRTVQEMQGSFDFLKGVLEAFHCRTLLISNSALELLSITKVSDPAIGGTYMTLLNTVANIAVAIPKTVVLWLVDVVSFKDCTGVTDFNLDCDNYNELQHYKSLFEHEEL
ncbi:hypothetical protein EMCRGX_G016799 [Ephydatia muelleri]